MNNDDRTKTIIYTRQWQKLGGQSGNISHKNRENQDKCEEKGQNGKLAGSLPLLKWRAGYGPATKLFTIVYSKRDFRTTE